MAEKPEEDVNTEWVHCFRVVSHSFERHHEDAILLAMDENLKGLYQSCSNEKKIVPICCNEKHLTTSKVMHQRDADPNPMDIWIPLLKAVKFVLLAGSVYLVYKKLDHTSQGWTMKLEEALQAWTSKGCPPMIKITPHCTLW